MAPTTPPRPFSVLKEAAVPEINDTNNAPVHLQNPQHDELLNIIDTLRSQGITEYIDLPQLIVCGDQSAGKSSVLEAISGGLRFPAKEGTCTLFATELALRRSPNTQFHVTIVPDKKRPQAEIDLLSKFQPKKLSLDAFPEIIDAASEAMGLKGSEKSGSERSFSMDILRVELSGPTQPHLTLVDLPGLYHAGDKRQSKAEVPAVHSLVKTYMRKERSIILAVVSAKNDYNNQVVTEYAIEADPQGERTLGIITKPDFLYSGSETMKKFQNLVTDRGGLFKHGWNVLRNRDYTTRHFTTEERDKAEEEFFQSDDWKHIDKDRLGVRGLRKRLSDTLLTHILKELPRVFDDVQAGITRCEQELKSHGPPRGSLESQRSYLFRASQAFATLMQASIDGDYHDPFFGSSDTEEGCKRRLRAAVQNIMFGFAERMRVQGHALQLVDRVLTPKESQQIHPKLMNRDDFLKYVESRIQDSRGRELRGIFNPAIIGSLFLDKAKPWKEIMRLTQELLLQAAENTITKLLEHVTDPITAQAIHIQLIQRNMDVMTEGLTEKIEEVLKPHTTGYPVTFNDSFVENIQRQRRGEIRKQLANNLFSFFRKDPEAESDADRVFEGRIDVRTLLESLVLKAEADFERFACVEATNAMEAYYKVAVKTVIDAFGVYAIEACLLDKLPTVFNTDVVMKLDDADIANLASEPADTIRKRKDLEDMLSALRSSFRTLQTMKIRRVSDPARRPIVVASQDTLQPAITPPTNKTRSSRSNSMTSQDSAVEVRTPESERIVLRRPRYWQNREGTV